MDEALCELLSEAVCEEDGVPCELLVDDACDIRREEE